MPRPRILPTVPAKVRVIAQDREWLEKQGPAFPAIALRLVSYEEMNRTWKLVGQRNENDFDTIFFGLVLRLPAKWQSLPKAPTQKLKANVERIASSASALAAALDAHDTEIAFIRGWPLTFHHAMVRSRYIRNELMHGGKPPDGWTYALSDRSRHPDPTLQDLLLSVAAELRPSRVASDVAIRPRRVADQNAERTFMVRWMASFFQSSFGKPKFDLVAATVNTLLDDPDSRLDASHARKLAPKLL